jgi:hypothetical protein
LPAPRTQQAIARLADLVPRQIVAKLERYPGNLPRAAVEQATVLEPTS